MTSKTIVEVEKYVTEKMDEPTSWERMVVWLTHHKPPESEYISVTVNHSNWNRKKSGFKAEITHKVMEPSHEQAE